MENFQDTSHSSLGFVATQHRNHHGTVTKLRCIQRCPDEGSKSKNASALTHKVMTLESRNLKTSSDTKATTKRSSNSTKNEVKTLPPTGKRHSKHKATPGKEGGREEVNPIKQQQVSKSKTPRPSKVPQVYKPKGDGSKVTEAHQSTRNPDAKGGSGKTEETAHKIDKGKAILRKDGSKKTSTNSRKRSSKPPQFPSEDEVKMTAKVLKTRGYLMEGKLGEGTYAKVRRAYSYHHNCRVAIKIVSRSRLNARFKQKFLPRELKIVQSIRHPHIIELLEMFENNGVIFLIMELARHGDLLEYVQKKHALRDSEARTVFTQVISAVEYLHSRGIFHRDLKCENILLDWGPTGITAKLTDFGFAREWNDAFKPCSTFCGSAAYASPEILQAIPYDPYWADIWSMGVVLYIMITGRMPFDDSNIRDALEDMHNNRLNFSRRRLVCIEVQRLLRSILTYDPHDRPSTLSIRGSAWMRGRCTMPHPSAKLSTSVGGI